MSRRRIALGVAVVAATAAATLAHVRLHNPANLSPLFWGQPGNVGVVINDQGSDDIADGSHATALRNAFQAWSDAPGTTATLVEDTDPAQQARTDYLSTSIHLVMFDEANATGFFPGGSATVAVTPISFFSNGSIADADVLFNGSGFQFTTSGAAGRFDVQAVATHELGHLLGLDHSGVASSTMYPFVDPTVVLTRSLSDDDVHGVRDAYPAGGFARITGRVLRAADDSVVAGAYVVARGPDGRTAGATLSSATGTFAIVGLEPGTYAVYAAPLDGPVDSSNLTAGHTIETDFEATVHGASVPLSAGQTVAIGDLAVGADVAVDLGRNTDTFPLPAVIGQSRTHTILGTGLAGGSTLTASDPDLVLSAVLFLGSQLTFTVTTPAGEAPGHADLRVTNPLGEIDILPGALEIAPPAPTVSGIVPASGSPSGATPVTISGTGFRSGARVVLGDRIYVDGDPGGAVVVDPGTITLTTAPTAAGVHDVVVIDSTGVEGRLTSGFTATDVPTISTVFPAAGSFEGGTSVRITGAGFLPGAVVRIDGVAQSGATVVTDGLVTFSTAGGPVQSGLALEVENPGGGSASVAFDYVATPDPSVSSVTPGSGSTAGGETITLSGANLPGDAQVAFGVDPDTGLGGFDASQVVVVDGSTVMAETPALSEGMMSVLVASQSTGQATVVPAAYFANAPESGGGGCSVGAPPRPPDARRVLAGAWWLAALALWVALRRQRYAAPSARAESAVEYTRPPL